MIGVSENTLAKLEHYFSLLTSKGFLAVPATKKHSRKERKEESPEERLVRLPVSTPRNRTGFAESIVLPLAGQVKVCDEGHASAVRKEKGSRSLKSVLDEKREHEREPAYSYSSQKYADKRRDFTEWMTLLEEVSHQTLSIGEIVRSTTLMHEPNRLKHAAVFKKSMVKDRNFCRPRALLSGSLEIRRPASEIAKLCAGFKLPKTDLYDRQPYLSYNNRVIKTIGIARTSYL
jgi:hypothetical protein